MTNIIFVADIVEENGKTVRENNQAKQHDIPVGQLVEIIYEDYENSNKGVRMFVVNHSRDCDGTPLYDLSYERNAYKEFEEHEIESKNLTGQERQLALMVEWKYKGLISRHWGRESIEVV